MTTEQVSQEALADQIRGWMHETIADPSPFPALAGRLLERFDIREKAPAPASSVAVLDVAITRMPVTSSNVDSYGYDGERRILEIAYLPRGDAPLPVYRYLAVPPAVAAELHEVATRGGSVGGYIAKHIKSHYECVRLPEEAAGDA